MQDVAYYTSFDLFVLLIAASYFIFLNGINGGQTAFCYLRNALTTKGYLWQLNI